jgi:hypothetical protein
VLLFDEFYPMTPHSLVDGDAQSRSVRVQLGDRGPWDVLRGDIPEPILGTVQEKRRGSVHATDNIPRNVQALKPVTNFSGALESDEGLKRQISAVE